MPEGFSYSQKQVGLGIALEEDRIVALQAEVSPKGVSITSADEQVLPPDIISHGRIVSPVELVDNFYLLKKSAKFNHKKASINLPIHSCSIKTFTLPEGYFSSDAESLEWEMKQHLAGNLSDYKLAMVVSGKLGTNEVIIAIAAHPELVDERVVALRNCSIKAQSVDPDLIAIHNAYSVLFGNYPSKRVLLLDMNTPYSSFGFVMDDTFHPGGCFPVTASSFEEKSIKEYSQMLIENFNAIFEIHGFSLHEESVEMLFPAGPYADPSVVEKLAGYLGLIPPQKDLFGSGAVKLKKKTDIPSYKLIKAFGLAMRSAVG